MSFYLNILSVSGPIQFGHDDNQRVLWSINLTAMARAPVTDWPREVRRVLIDAALVTVGVDVFLSTKATMPPGDGPYTTIIDTGGIAPLETQDGQEIERRACQVTIRAKDYDTGRTLALAEWRALDGIRNTTISA